jgi:hypothetical protein
MQTHQIRIHWNFESIETWHKGLWTWPTTYGCMLWIVEVSSIKYIHKYA